MRKIKFDGYKYNWMVDSDSGKCCHKMKIVQYEWADMHSKGTDEKLHCSKCGLDVFLQHGLSTWQTYREFFYKRYIKNENITDRT